MTDATPESLAAMAANMLPTEPPPTEAQIDDFLRRMAFAFQVPEGVVVEARRLIHARFAIRMDKGETLTSEDDHAPWLDARRAAIDPFYWTRYRELLIKNGWPPLVAATLDRATDELLDLLGNPADTRAWQRRGLVMGDVQSGKTATYAALVCKAADAGYRMVILLTGMLENVRRQTQERLDEAFIGFDSSDFLGSAKLRHKRHIGVGLIDGRRDGVVFTSREHDFRKNAASALNVALNALSEPVLVVTKKNKAVLERLATWLRARNADRRGRIDLPMLLVDDEADNASINTKKDPNETTAINKSIRDLLGLFERSSYVGFTATPFANIFVDPSSTDEMLGDDLFPRDFIHVLRAPDNYVGMNRLFPTADDEPEQAVAGDTLRIVDDAEDWLPGGHKKDHEPGALPASLLSAVRCFLIACAVRDLRARRGDPGRGGGIHRSMLVNVSRFTDVQNRVADAIHLELEDIRRAVRLHGGLGPSRAAERSSEVAALARTFADEFEDAGVTWPEILEALHDAIAPVRVQPVNQSTGAKSLDYRALAAPPGVRVIAVGGNSLSRGLTLEGLSTSYFLRDARAYDTLLQMGRWFGYRDGYADLCRLWLTDEARGWYEHVTEATGELKRDFARMKRRQATPREFGLRVRTHPDTLLITARNKMASGLDVVVQRDISLMGRGIESSRLYADRRRNETNAGQIDRFLAALRDGGSAPEPSPHGGALVWRNVPAAAVAAMLEEFLVHPLNFDFQGDAIAEFLRARATPGDALSTWTVALPTEGSAAEVTEIPALAGLGVKAGKRKVKSGREDGSLLVSGKSARVGGRPDLRHAFGKEEYEALRSADRASKEDELREAMRAPLLVVYLLRGVQAAAPGAEEVPYRDGLLLPALGMHFPGAPDPDAPRHLVRYRLNRVAQRELLPEGEVEDDDVADGGDDDVD
ncbi:Z1 domain-containing protein [Roseomonas mucosa]|uniref:Z1 domain-containing protein n=1 Tax=Roseomonas mucosa TaxID=207340 RepID=UPI0028CE8D8E|nr:Z1 domain-containing protein [Roseomonas mucosa]MDT8278134.1 Z1 domain-containing protein [Roseomonas mucosa]